MNGVDLQLNRGEFLALLGASGCGKSTVLRVMAGLQALSGGSLDSKVLHLAFVFQEPALLPWATLQDNVGLPLRLKGMPAAQWQERVARVLEQVGLSGRGLALPHELSGGMKMRASVARALVTEPELLLLDEPFAALDDPTRQRLQADLARWAHSRKLTVCFVTHQVSEAVFLATRVAVMGGSPGRIHRTIELPEPVPREEAFRRSPVFHDQCVKVAEAVAQCGAGDGSELLEREARTS